MPTTVGGSTSGLPIDSLIAKTNTTPAQTGSGSTLGEDAFLKLLTTQLRYQDPLKPMDDTQTIAQLAQFSSLQAQTDLKNSFQKFQSNFGVLQAASLVGRNVTVSTPDAAGNASSAQGIIAGLQIINGQPEFTIKDAAGHIFADKNGNPALFTTSQIIGIT